METPTARTLSRNFQLFERSLPLVLLQPFGIPDMQLLQVDGVELQLRRLSSVQLTMYSKGKTSWMPMPGRAGQKRFFGGTFVATYMRCRASRITLPTSFSLWPFP